MKSPLHRSPVRVFHLDGATVNVMCGNEVFRAVLSFSRDAHGKLWLHFQRCDGYGRESYVEELLEVVGSTFVVREA